MTICIPPPHHQDGRCVILQMMKLLFCVTGNSSVSLFLMEKKTYDIAVNFVSWKVWISLLMIMKIMPFFHFVFLNFPQTVIITWHMHDFVNGSDPVSTVCPIYRTQILLSPIDHTLSQQTYLLSFWDMLHNLFSFLPKMLCICSVIFFWFIKYLCFTQRVCWNLNVQPSSYD